ncbi:pPIWI_RE module domain-containing protein [Streptomyces sp. NPDC015125]|uniref:pPIWI_RE module domain-containing protein n=1 Tax=Streptomyces sp. NPDC015125 TaxID=3364938 RepID=UPI0037007B26
MYREIRRSAYHLADPATPWTEDYRALRFPERWQSTLMTLHNHGRPEAEWQRGLPTRSLDTALQTLAPEVIVRPRARPPIGEGPMPPEDFWMYVPADVPDPLPGRAGGQVLNAWLRTLVPRRSEYNPEMRALLLRCSDELTDIPLSWESVPGVDLLGAHPTDGGTAAPETRQFQLATDALARRIRGLDPYPFEGGELRFRALPRGPRDQGAELMSQPLCRTIKRKEWWFSITLNISLHTAPFDPRPRLHLHWGVRRWATHTRSDTGRLPLPYGQSTTVHLRPKIPWLPGVPATERGALARLRRDRASDGFTWAENDPAGILHQLSVVGRFPAPDRLLADPADWIGDGPGVRAAVVHSNHMGVHEVGPGLMPHQRSQLTAWAEAALPAGVVRLPDLVRGRGKGIGAPANRRPKPVGEPAKKAEEARAALVRSRALAVLADRTGLTSEPAAGQAHVTVRLLWRTAELRRHAVREFARTLGLDGDGGAHALPEQAFDDARPSQPAVLEWRTPELVVQLRCLPLTDGLGDRLVLDPAVRRKGERAARALAARRRKLSGWLRADGADLKCPGLALVEIAHRSTFREADTDPKFANRLGCADAGVLTQFVVTPSGERRIANADTVEHRAHHAWLDGFRQLGVRVLPEHTLGGDLPDGLQYAALWMVKRRKDGPTRLPRHLPVAVLVTPLPEGSGLCVVRGWDDDTRTWIPYPHFLLGLVKKAEIDPYAPGETGSGGTADDAPRITAKARRTNLSEQRRETARFLQRMLHSLRNHPTVLITHAQNSRSHWPWLQDGQIEPDMIRIGHAPPGGIDDELRLVRVRGRAGRETAQWWGLAEPGKAHGQPAGFWAVRPSGDARREPGERVFHSSTERPGTFAISPALDRLAARVNAAGNLTSQAGTGAWNPTLVEIAVLGCHTERDAEPPSPPVPDEPEAIALATHQLRMAPDYPVALSLPLPLHLAGLAQAYVLPTVAADEPGAETTDGETAADPSDERAESPPDAPDPDAAYPPGPVVEPEAPDEPPLL